MSAHAHLVSNYLRLRKVGIDLNNRLVGSLGKDVYDEGARSLGVLHGGKLVLGSMDELSIVMDYCIHNVYRRGRNAVERMLADSPPSDLEELAVLKAMARAHYSIFLALEPERGVGVTVRDVLREQTIFVVDVEFSKSMRPGFGLAGRVIPLDGWFMTAGAMLPFDRRAADRVDDDIERWLASGRAFARFTAAENADLAARIIRACLETGAMEHIAYATPGEPRSGGRWSLVQRAPVRANRNDPCPCGSGRKYKSCCGKR
jgi:hypothetical protein